MQKGAENGDEAGMKEKMKDKPLLPSDAAMYPGNMLIRLSWERTEGALDAKRRPRMGMNVL